MKKQIHDSLSLLIVKKLERYNGSRLNRETCLAIYRDLFECLVEVFGESGINLTNESVNLIAQMYYDMITIKDSVGNVQDLDPNIFDKRAKMENIEIKELAMLATLFNSTPIGSVLVHSIKRRS